MTPMLEVRDLSAAYGRARVLYEIGFEVAAGEVLALLGRNGAGKSTTVKAIMGLTPQREGTIRFRGRDIARLPPHAIARLGVGYVPEERRIFTDLTVLENLTVGRRAPREGLPRWTLERLFELFPNLSELRHRPASRMSGGEQQMLALARTLMGQPSLLLLDEPSEGLAPVIVQQIASSVTAIKREGVGVVLSEQNLRFAGAVADRAVVLESGRAVFGGTMDELTGNPELARRYLAL